MTRRVALSYSLGIPDLLSWFSFPAAYICTVIYWLTDVEPIPRYNKLWKLQWPGPLFKVLFQIYLSFQSKWRNSESEEGKWVWNGCSAGCIAQVWNAQSKSRANSRTKGKNSSPVMRLLTVCCSWVELYVAIHELFRDIPWFDVTPWKCELSVCQTADVFW